MTGRGWRRRCLSASCDEWLAIDPADPDADERRYCSEACERRDRREIQRVEREIAAAGYLAAHRRARHAPARYFDLSRTLSEAVVDLIGRKPNRV